MEYCSCGSIKTLGVCDNKRCPAMDNKQRTWIISGRELTFREPVTRAEAEKLAPDTPKPTQTYDERQNKYIKLHTGGYERG